MGIRLWRALLAGAFCCALLALVWTWSRNVEPSPLQADEPRIVVASLPSARIPEPDAPLASSEFVALVQDSSRSAPADPEILPVPPALKSPEISVPSSQVELEILRLGRGLAGADLLRTRVAFKEATVDKIAADPKYNPWKAQLEEQDRAEIRRILEVAQRELVALRYQRMKHEIALKSVMRAAGQYDVAGPGVSDQPSSPDESVWQMMTPESGNILIRLRPGMNPEIDRAALAESILMAEAERSFIARFLAAHQRATRR